MIYLFKHPSILSLYIYYTRMEVIRSYLCHGIHEIAYWKYCVEYRVAVYHLRFQLELVNPFLSFLLPLFFLFLFLQYIPCLRARNVQIDRLSMRICAQSINESLCRIDTPCFVPFRRITLFGKRRVELNAISLFLFISRIRDAHPASRCAKHEVKGT